MLHSIFVGPIGLLLVLLGLIVRTGRAAWLVNNGWRYLTPEQKATFDQVMLFKFIGFITIVSGLLLTLAAALFLLQLAWLPFTLISVGIIMLAAGNMYAIKSSRFRRPGSMPIKFYTMRKRSSIIAAVLTFVIMLGVGILVFASLRPPNVQINQDSLQVTGLYGVTINFEEITSLTLVEESMRDIGPGMRLNGTSAGGTLRGIFTAGRLFVQNAGEGPTIRITSPADTVFISLSESASTRRLYEDLTRAMNN